MSLNASPMALVPEAQAVQTEVLGPRSPHRTEILPLAALMMSFGNHEGGNAIRPTIKHPGMLFFDFVEPTDAAANENTIAIRITLCEVDSGLLDGPMSTEDCELTKTVDPPSITGVEVDESAEIKIADLTTESHFEVAAVKSLNQANAAFTSADRIPDVIHVESQGSNDSHAGDYNSTA